MCRRLCGGCNFRIRTSRKRDSGSIMGLEQFFPTGIGQREQIEAGSKYQDDVLVVTGLGDCKTAIWLYSSFSSPIQAFRDWS
jgi:hypothetical protein